MGWTCAHRDSPPQWLIGPSGHPLELDGYCAELNMAFEYNGAQHYEEIPYMKIDARRLKNIQKRDSYKKKICSKLGVQLFIIKDCRVKSKKTNSKDNI